MNNQNSAKRSQSRKSGRAAKTAQGSRSQQRQRSGRQQAVNEARRDGAQQRQGTYGQVLVNPPRSGVIEKRELITLVNGSTAFAAVKFPVNPGLTGTFPLGAPEAKNWTEWKCTSMKVQYIPTVSEFATQGQKGEVAIAIDYNAENEMPTTMQQIEAMHFAGGGIPSRGFEFTASPRYLNKADPKYLRSGPAPVGEDLRLYDGGNLYFATQGCTDATQIGKLEVSYRFEVHLPTLLNQGSETGSARVAAFTSNANTVTSGVPETLPFESVQENNLGITNAAGVFTLPEGNFLLSSWCRCSGATTMTDCLLSVHVDGSPTADGAQFVGLSGAGATATPSISRLIQSDGTTEAEVVVTITGTGALSRDAYVTFTAV